jgi:hypothetical protein
MRIKSTEEKKGVMLSPNKLVRLTITADGSRHFSLVAEAFAQGVGLSLTSKSGPKIYKPMVELKDLQEEERTDLNRELIKLFTAVHTHTVLKEEKKKQMRAGAVLGVATVPLLGLPGLIKRYKVRKDMDPQINATWAQIVHQLGSITEVPGYIAPNLARTILFTRVTDLAEAIYDRNTMKYINDGHDLKRLREISYALFEAAKEADKQKEPTAWHRSPNAYPWLPGD